jgi:hypothetical protein
MFMFWLSIVLAILIGSLALLAPPVGVGLLIIALVLAGNAFVRLQRGTPPKSRVNAVATWVALAVSSLGFICSFLFVRG